APEPAAPGDGRDPPAAPGGRVEAGEGTGAASSVPRDDPGHRRWPGPSGDLERGADAHAGDPLRDRLVTRPHQRAADRGEPDQPAADLVTAAARPLLQQLVAQFG